MTNANAVSEVLASSLDDPSFYLNGQAMVSLQLAELDYVESVLGAQPIRRVLLPPRPEAVDPGIEPRVVASLSEGGLIDDGGVLSGWFASILKLAAAPKLWFMVERWAEDVIYRWLYAVDTSAFIEQVETEENVTFLAGGAEQLLGRILLNAGLMRFVDEPSLSAADPLSGSESWQTLVTKVSIEDGGPRKDVVRFECGNGRLTIEDQLDPDRQWAPANPRRVAEFLVELLGGTPGNDVPTD